MSASMRLRIASHRAAPIGRPIVTLALALVLALGGCAMDGDQPGAGDATAGAASSCEQQYERATQECELTLDPELNAEESQACRGRALEEFQACRGS
jgi:hypothetical protein